MSQLTKLGTEMPLDALSVELKRRIEARGLGPPRSFTKWAEQILVDHPERKALVLAAGARIEGSVQYVRVGAIAAGREGGLTQPTITRHVATSSR